jgi:hypothetical protein
MYTSKKFDSSKKYSKVEDFLLGDGTYEMVKKYPLHGIIFDGADYVVRLKFAEVVILNGDFKVYFEVAINKMKYDLSSQYDTIYRTFKGDGKDLEHVMYGLGKSKQSNLVSQVPNWLRQLNEDLINRYKESITKAKLEKEIKNSEKPKEAKETKEKEMKKDERKPKDKVHEAVTILEDGFRKCSVPGVTWDRSKEKWECRISINGKRKRLGYFDDVEKAINERKMAEKRKEMKND